VGQRGDGAGKIVRIKGGRPRGKKKEKEVREGRIKKRRPYGLNNTERDWRGKKTGFYPEEVFMGAKGRNGNREPGSGEGSFGKFDIQIGKGRVAPLFRGRQKDAKKRKLGGGRKGAPGEKEGDTPKPVGSPRPKKKRGLGKESWGVPPGGEKKNKSVLGEGKVPSPERGKKVVRALKLGTLQEGRSTGSI